MHARSSSRALSGQRYFFYGTLIAGHDNPACAAAHRHLGRGVAGHVRGALWAIADPGGWYPALVAGDGRVRGVVYRALDGLDVAMLDAYEGEEYRRETAMVAVDGAMVAAQAYWWAGALPKGAVLVAHGDFRQWLTEQGFTAFGG